MVQGGPRRPWASRKPETVEKKSKVYRLPPRPGRGREGTTQDSPGKPREARGEDQGEPMESSRRHREAQGGPGKPREAQKGRGRPRKAEGGSGRRKEGLTFQNVKIGLWGWRRERPDLRKCHERPLGLAAGSLTFQNVKNRP